MAVAPDIPPDSISGFSIRSVVGRGGVATVYLALQESLEREVALKVMSPVLAAQTSFSERFIREGRTIAKLTHPNIVTIYDIGVSGHHHYIAMEYLGGGSLTDRLGKPLPEERALGWLAQVASALGFAHRKGFVHRDVKPGNVLFRGDGAAVLTDFGIAKSVASSTELTSIGAVIGTPRYISPEQARGLQAEPRSDIYALGIILFEMLTGKPPYDGEDSMAVLYAHVNEPLPQLPDDQQHLQPLIDSMLAKQPDDRVPDCETLVDLVRLVRHGSRDASGVLERARAAPPPEPDAGSTVIMTRNDTVPKAGSDASTDWHEMESDPGKPGDARHRPFSRRVVRLAAWAGAPVAVVLIVLAVLDEEPAPEPPASLETQASVETGSAGDGQDSVAATKSEPAAVPPPPRPDPVVIPHLERPPSLAYDPPLAMQRAAAGTTPPAPAPAPAPARAQEPAIDQERLVELLVQAERQLEAERLAHPPDDNALDTYREVLALDPDNRKAHQGLQRIAETYLQLARDRMATEQYEEARLYVERGLSAVPGHEKLDALAVTLTDIIDAREAFREAERLYYGEGAPRDRDRAIELYAVAAEKGHAAAQNALGVAYANGVGVPRDENKALEWLRRAANQGHLAAQYNLAMGLLFSDHARPEEAREWMLKAGSRGLEESYRVLGWMYATGTGGSLSVLQSMKWGFKGSSDMAGNTGNLNEKRVYGWEARFEREFEEANLTEPRTVYR